MLWSDSDAGSQHDGETPGGDGGPGESERVVGGKEERERMEIGGSVQTLACPRFSLRLSLDLQSVSRSVGLPAVRASLISTSVGIYRQAIAYRQSIVSGSVTYLVLSLTYDILNMAWARF